jgi:hypothetical protein
MQDWIHHAAMIAISVAGFTPLADASLGPYEPKGFKDNTLHEQENATSSRLDSPTVGSGMLAAEIAASQTAKS